jgi:hypothetical protein
MFRTLALLALLLSPPSTTQPSSADGVVFSDPIPTTYRPARISPLGNALGNTPESFVGRRAISYERSRVQAVDLWEKAGGTTIAGEDESGLFIAKGPPGDVVRFRVTDGRIVSVEIIWKHSDQSNDAVAADTDRLSKKFENPRIVATGSVNPLNGHKAIEIKLHPADWYLLNHKVPEDIANAIRSEKPIIGMDEQQVRAAMWKYQQLTPTEAARGKIIQFIPWGAVVLHDGKSHRH